MNIKKGLSIDGGGVLGIGSITALNLIEKHIGIKVKDYFDYYVGNSVGSIILGTILGSDKVKDCNDALNVFEDLAWEIFKRPPLFNYFGPKYNKENYYSAINKILDDSTYMRDINKYIYIPTTDFDVQDTKVFSSTRTPEVKLKYAIECSMSAPTYFSAVDDKYVDGGLWANNPALVGIFGYKNDTNVELKNMSLLSLGSGGIMKQANMLNKSDRYSILKWAGLIIDFAIKSNERSNDFYVKNMGLNKYLRLIPELNDDKFAKFDNPRLMKEYKEIWHKYTLSNLSKIDDYFNTY